MVKMQDAVFCDGCGVEILLSPVVKAHGEYCCDDCAQGYKCECGKRTELEDPEANGDIPAGGVL